MNHSKRYRRYADHYQRYAYIPSEMGNRLWDHVSWCRLDPKWILDVGSGPKTLAKDHFPESKVMALDACFEMVQKVGGHALCADAHALPIQTGCVDLVVANALVHWLSDPLAFLREARRVLKEDGAFFFSTLGPDTLKEARHIWQSLGRSDAINPMRDLHDWGDDLRSLGFRDPVLDTQTLEVTFSSPQALLKCLKYSGSGAITPHQGLMTPAKLRSFYEAYEAHQTEDGRYRATFEMIMAQAWGAPPPSQSQKMIFKPIQSKGGE